MKSKLREYVPLVRDRHFRCPGCGKLGDTEATHCHTVWPTPHGLCDVTVIFLSLASTSSRWDETQCPGNLRLTSVAWRRQIPEKRIGSNTPVWNPDFAMSMRPTFGSCRRCSKLRRSTQRKGWLGELIELAVILLTAEWILSPRRTRASESAPG